MSVMASIGAILNLPMIAVWQRDSVGGLGTGWCMPDSLGQITAHEVFQFLLINQLSFELTVLWEPEAENVQSQGCLPSDMSMPIPGMAGCGRCEAERLKAKVAETGNWIDGLTTGMMVCAECGNKRCPRAAWHGHVCTGSNKPG